MQDKTKGEFLLPTTAVIRCRILFTSFRIARICVSPVRHLRHYFHVWILVQTLGHCPTVWSPRSWRNQVAPPPIFFVWTRCCMICVCHTTPTQKLFYLHAFRLVRPPQRVDCLSPRWKIALNTFPKDTATRYRMHQESN